MQLKYIATVSAFILLISGLAVYNYMMRIPPVSITKDEIYQSHDTVPVRQPAKAHVETID